MSAAGATQGDDSGVGDGGSGGWCDLGQRRRLSEARQTRARDCWGGKKMK